ncbi:hypothetical protein PVK06_044606 [Gossypium arboreum]|uniref:Uncharacterized protein n=1 Tax=Gossypium arboreum TaxID=29729 RepID=A0ABR0MRN5_GOSAR|nr:hypothetical protein PVK06_044606 [Gossypium arboreum]
MIKGVIFYSGSADPLNPKVLIYDVLNVLRLIYDVLNVLRRMITVHSYHYLYQWYRSVESEHFPDPSGFRSRMEQWTFGLSPACIKYRMSAFDVPEVMAVTRSNICKNGIQALSRRGAVIYYASVFLYF